MCSLVRPLSPHNNILNTSILLTCIFQHVHLTTPVTCLVEVMTTVMMIIFATLTLILILHSHSYAVLEVWNVIRSVLKYNIILSYNLGVTILHLKVVGNSILLATNPIASFI